MIFFIVLTTFILLLVSLLLVPITICADTISNQYYIQFRGLVKANIEKHEAQIFRVQLKILFMKFYIYPLKKKSLNKQRKIKKAHLSKPKRRMSFFRIFKILRTFKIKQFYINMDTGNYVLNAKLYPLFVLLNYNTGNFHINFQGRNQLVLVMKNRPIDIIKSFINF